MTQNRKDVPWLRTGSMCHASEQEGCVMAQNSNSTSVPCATIQTHFQIASQAVLDKRTTGGLTTVQCIDPEYIPETWLIFPNVNI
jgi:hypothetical protein